MPTGAGVSVWTILYNTYEQIPGWVFWVGPAICAFIAFGQIGEFVQFNLECRRQRKARAALTQKQSRPSSPVKGPVGT